MGTTQRACTIMKIGHAVAVALLAAAWGASPAMAQSDGYVQIVPGVWTTPEISRRCQEYARKTEPREGADSRRQSLALNCAKRLYQEEQKKKKKGGG
jgi:hypothetical protein